MGTSNVVYWTWITEGKYQGPEGTVTKSIPKQFDKGILEFSNQYVQSLYTLYGYNTSSIYCQDKSVFMGDSEIGAELTMKSGDNSVKFDWGN